MLINGLRSGILLQRSVSEEQFKLAAGHKIIVDSLKIGQTRLCESKLTVAEIEVAGGAYVEALFHDSVRAVGLTDAFGARCYLLHIYLDVIHGEIYLHGHTSLEVFALELQLLHLKASLLDGVPALASWKIGTDSDSPTDEYGVQRILRKGVPLFIDVQL